MGNLGAFDLSLFLSATFTASLVAGMAGFAFANIAAAVWLHVLTPLQTATLIVAFGLIVQGYAVWKLRHSLRVDRLWPFLVGGAIGVPVGVAVLRAVSVSHMRAGVGLVLIAFSVYSLARPRLPKATGGGQWLGLRLFGKLNERAFRLIVLGLLLVSGVALLLR